MSAPERPAPPDHKSPSSEPKTPSAVSMSELLESCAAADAVSTPPREPEQDPERDTGSSGREAA